LVAVGVVEDRIRLRLHPVGVVVVLEASLFGRVGYLVLEGNYMFVLV
jgi:hypothetical protein